MASEPDVNRMAGRWGVYGLVLLWLALWVGVVAWASGIGVAGVVRVLEVWVVDGWGTAVVLGAGWGLGWLGVIGMGRVLSGAGRDPELRRLGSRLCGMEWVLVWLLGIGVWLWGVGLVGRLGLLPELGLMLDAGTAAFRVHDRYASGAITAGRLDVVLTHAHLDHIVGLTHLLLLERPDGRAVETVVHARPEVIEAVRTHLLSMPLLPVSPVTRLEPLGDSLELASGARITTFPLEHPG
ncbi:MAG: MBL fold metallo-hydrolase, partial [Planctomycetota bacterium]